MAVQDLLSQDEIDALLHGVMMVWYRPKWLPSPVASKVMT